MTDRERALRVLDFIEKKRLPADDAIARQPGIEQTDFVRTLVFGVLRWRKRLDFAIGRLAKRPAKKIDAIPLQILRLGAYQIWFMNVPSYAAVSESVSLTGKLAPRARSFVNAVLRRVSENELADLTVESAGAEAVGCLTSHPTWMIERWAAEYGIDRAKAIAEANQELSYPDLLVNTERTTTASLLGEMRSRGLSAEPSSLVNDVIRLRSSTSPLGDLARDGAFYAMDEGSVAVTQLFPDDVTTVLDIAAAPGGKSLALRMAGKSVTSADLSLRRLHTLEKSWRRMFTDAPSIVVADAARPPFSAMFDAVLLDAPCTASGTIRKHPEVRWRLARGESDEMAVGQTRLLRSALGLARRYVLYVTCSIEPEENRRVVEAALADRDEFETLDLSDSAPDALLPWVTKGALSLTPESGADGFSATLIGRTRQ